MGVSNLLFFYAIAKRVVFQYKILLTTYCEKIKTCIIKLKNYFFYSKSTTSSMGSPSMHTAKPDIDDLMVISNK